MSEKLDNLKDVQYATFDRRMIASSIDIMIMTIILYPLMAIVNFVLYRGGISLDEFFTTHGRTVSAEDLGDFIMQEHLIVKWLFVQGVVFIAMAAYFIWFWYRKGATPGKLVIKCRIIDANTNQPPSLKQCIGRFFGYMLSVVPIFAVTAFMLYASVAHSFQNWYVVFVPLSCFGFFIQTVTKKKQALHDLVSGTTVIKLIDGKKKKFFIF